jgi:hypothetical protein
MDWKGINRGDAMAISGASAFGASGADRMREFEGHFSAALPDGSNSAESHFTGYRVYQDLNYSVILSSKHVV